jgi:hypothetical protein
MKRVRILLLVLIVLSSLTVPGTLAPAKGADELPCDPFPPMIRRCELAGGKFDFVTCRCILPTG